MIGSAAPVALLTGIDALVGIDLCAARDGLSRGPGVDGAGVLLLAVVHRLVVGLH